MDKRARTYRKLVLHHDRLVGATLLGDLSLVPRLSELLRTGEAVPGRLLDAEENGRPTADALVCCCNSVTRGDILAAARERKLERTEQIAQATGAATCCGGCAGAVEGLLAELREAARAELL